MNTKLKLQVVLITLTSIVLGISLGLYIAAAFIGPAIMGN